MLSDPVAIHRALFSPAFDVMVEASAAAMLPKQLIDQSGRDARRGPNDFVVFRRIGYQPDGPGRVSRIPGIEYVMQPDQFALVK